jgi:hypothetical protein
MKFNAVPRITGITAFAQVIIYSVPARFGGKGINSAGALKEYLDSQPANSPGNPVKVTMNTNGLMLKDIAQAINSAGKYVSLNFSGGALTMIEDGAFYSCAGLTGITIPDSVSIIGDGAFYNSKSLAAITMPDNVAGIGDWAFYSCASLTSVTFRGPVAPGGFDSSAFPSYDMGDLRAKFYAANSANGTPGTYTRESGISRTWTKQ